MKNNIHVISFGNNDYYLRLSNYVVKKISNNNLNCIPYVYDLDDLPKEMIEFCNQHKKGFGFMVWKPYIVQKTFEIMNDNDILLYIDGRTYYTGKKIHYFSKLLNNQSIDGIFWRLYGLFENQYSKGDFFKLLGIDDENVKFTSQIATTFFFLKKNEITTNLVRDWNNFMNLNRQLFINDSSNFPNENGFITNRHDQSIFSILVKSNKDLNPIFLSYSNIPSLFKPHSIPHEFVLPNFVNILSPRITRIIYTLKKLSVMQIIRVLIGKLKSQKYV